MKHLVITIMPQKEDKPGYLIKEHVARCQDLIERIGIGEPNMISDTINFVALVMPMTFKRNGMNGLISDLELADEQQQK